MAILIVMLLAVCPKSYLHNIFSNHQDQEHFCHSEIPGQECLHNWGFACEINDLVVSHAYGSFDQPLLIVPLQQHIVFIVPLSAWEISTPFSTRDSRGPPVMS